MSVLWRAANRGFAVRTVASIGGIIVDCGAVWVVYGLGGCQPRPIEVVVKLWGSDSDNKREGNTSTCLQLLPDLQASSWLHSAFILREIGIFFYNLAAKHSP